MRDEIAHIEVADGYPRRSHQYLELLPFEYSYGPHQYPMILAFEQMAGLSVDAGDTPTWAKAKAIGSERVFIQPNRHLEFGRPLAEWLSDIPESETYFHYPLVTTEAHKARAHKLLAPARASGKPLIGISCASYRGSEAWRTWDREEWVKCLSAIIGEGWTPVLIGGSWDDLTSAVFDTLEEKHPDAIFSVVGKTHFGEVTEMLRSFDSYFGYSSGLNVIRTVLNKPAMALWPDYEGFSQEALSRSWAPPHMQEWESGRYIARLWRPFPEVWPTLKRYLRTCSDEIGKTLEPPCK